MNNSVNCKRLQDADFRRSRYQIRKLSFMKLLRDSLEQRLSAVNASIATLEKQIESNPSNQEPEVSTI